MIARDTRENTTMDHPATDTQKQIEAAGGVKVVGQSRQLKQVAGDRLKVMSVKTAEAIAEKFGPEMLATHLHSLATEAVSITKKGHEVPDNRTRLAATTLALAYVLGRPIERSETVNVNLDADAALGLKERLKSSPALRESLRIMLAEMGE